MSTSPEPAHSDDEDEIVSALSHWLAAHYGNAQLRSSFADIGTDGLSPDQRAAVEELLRELDDAPEGVRGSLEMLVRETLEAVAWLGASLTACSRASCASAGASSRSKATDRRAPAARSAGSGRAGRARRLGRDRRASA